MRLDFEALDQHLLAIAALVERYGITVDLEGGGDIAIDEMPSGGLGLVLRGLFPDDQAPPRSAIELRETWRPVAAGQYERSGYEYELLDRRRDFRRAWHLHDPEYFGRAFEVVVHEHCEMPIGRVSCDHYAGFPVRDAFAGVELIVDAWVDPDPPDCASLMCLEAS